ncbi:MULTISPECIES: sigma-70 family RNA polymerase sigma factor [unclassified Spirillospora]|uniref:sigma-70 family RNA polymerase sigma factor n=1 Tax=unclassified Spirillospora TaxID=2642701 RepID=UPI00371A111C
MDTGPMAAGEAAEFEAMRPRLTGIAYRMLGEVQEAEDAVQDAFLRWNRTDRAAAEEPRAWLTKVVTNLCLNRLTSARARRESYIWPWLPEPVPAAAPGPLEPLETVQQRDSVSLALLTPMESLTPAERAVFVLREAFAYPHRQIADILEVSEASSRVPEVSGDRITSLFIIVNPDKLAFADRALSRSGESSGPS